MDVPVVCNILGTIGTVCWSIQLIPQIVINYRRHNAVGLQPTMMLFWAWAGVPLGVYNIVENFNVALQIQPQILTCLSLTTWAQCHYYGRSWSFRHCLAVTVPLAVLMAGIQGALIVALVVARSRHIEWPVTLMAVLSAVLLAAGVLRHWWDIYLHRTVRGISFIFVALDAMGDVTSLASLLLEPKLDVLGLVIYGTELTLWLGVLAAGACYNFPVWLRDRLSPDSSRLGQPPNEFPDVGHRTQPSTADTTVALHDLPSSTSVFRTPSAEIEYVRSRNISHRTVLENAQEC